MNINEARLAVAFDSSQITNFTFPQPPAPQVHLATRNNTRDLFTIEGKLPVRRDITLNPIGRASTSNFLGASNQGWVDTVYPPDGRHNYKDTTYPWRCFGRVTSPVGTCAGTLVGPRHLLTASHCIDRTLDHNDNAGWLRFQPDFYDTDVFHDAYAIHFLSYQKGLGPITPETVAIDYTVAVLDQRLGDQLDYVGAKDYDPTWNNDNYWSHFGYPDDVGGGLRPAYEGHSYTIVGSFSQDNGLGDDLETFMSINHGASGGPVFGWWDNVNPKPYVVGFCSIQGGLNGTNAN